jgi:hypothetical protein
MDSSFVGHGPERQRWQGPVALSSRQRGRLTRRKPQMSEDNFRGKKEKLVAGPRWWPDTRIDWPTDRRS